jgi:prophage antirepressor-like protein
VSNLQLALQVPARLNPSNLRIRMLGTWEKPWLCLSDICAVVGIANPSNVAARVREADKITLRWVEGNRGNPSLVFVSESAFYKIVLRSDKAAAEPFADWVTEEVLPSIRKYGCYPPPAKPKPDLLPYTHRVLAAARVELVVPDGYWSVFTEAADVLIRAEQVLIPAGLTLDPDDLLDGSVGRRWSDYRKGKEWAGERVQYDYQFPFPSKRHNIVVHPNAYPMEELACFRRWLRREYLPVHFPAYLQGKFGIEGYQAALPYIRRVMPAALAAGS